MPRLPALTALLLAMVTAPAAAADGGTVSIKDPARFSALLAELGYKPEAVRRSGNIPILTVDIANQPTNILFGGCTNFVDCRYIILSSTYSDVPNPPASWITAMNDKFDVIKIGLSDEKNLYFSATHIIEGVPRATFREILESWDNDATALAEEAIKAKLDRK
jgi:hypothetical protein